MVKIKHDSAVIALILLSSPWLAFAQPVDQDVSAPPAVVDSPVYEIEVIESPSQVEQPTLNTNNPTPPPGVTAPAAQPEIAPVERIGKVDAPEEASGKKSGDTWSFSSGIDATPLTFVGSPESQATSGTLGANASLSSDFVTDAGNDFNLKLSYGFGWTENYTKAPDKDSRSFEHNTGLGLKIGMTEKWSASIGVGAIYSFSVNPIKAATPNWLSLNSLKFSGEVAQGLTLTMGYGADYSLDPQGAIYGSSQGIPTDYDDLVLNNFGFEPDGAASASDVVLAPNTYSINNKGILGLSYQVDKGPKLGFDYNPVFYTLTNAATKDWRGHYITASISQDAWEGGSLSLSHQLRIQNFQFETIDSGDPKSAYRNRTKVGLDHKVSDRLSLSMNYQLQLTTDNGADAWKPNNTFSMSTSYSF